MKFGDFTALSDVSLDVQAEEFVTLLGPSGCGKTTLLKLISGFLEPSEGRILMGGEDVTHIPPEKRDTALCFQSYALFPHLTVRENLEFGPRQKKVPNSERKARIDDVSEKLDLTAQLDKLPNQLSGGQQQRVSLGRALAMRPRVILFDEPLSNLDAKLRDQVRIEIRRIQKEYGLTAIYVTHDQAEALAMSDRIVVLNNGRVEQVASPETLYHAPKTKFVADFIGDANIFPGTVVGQIGDNVWQVETAIGALNVETITAPTSQRVNLCWRPESAIIGKAGIKARVVHRAFQGHFTDLMVETNGTVYRVQSKRIDAQEGDTVQLSVAPNEIILLGEDT
jgi:ABC-type Fe3+/spermidine/putrescine transport system ATPase subunit